MSRLTRSRLPSQEPVDRMPWAPGDVVQLDRETWTVRAATDHFHALTRLVTDQDRDAIYAEYECPDDCDGNDCDHLGCHADPPNMELATVFYTVVDWRNGVRGPCNLVGQGWGDGTYTETECTKMLADFESGRLRVSHRNRVAIRISDGAVR